MNKNILLAIVFLAGIGAGFLLAKEMKQSTEASTLQLVTNATKIDSYNAGWRAGQMDILAQLVECEGYSDDVTMMYYSTAVDTLARLGELDDSPYPCYE